MSSCQLAWVAVWQAVLTLLPLHGRALPSQPEYPWPSARGRMNPGQYGVSPHAAPKDWEKKLAWFFPGARGNLSTTFYGGVAIDDEGGVYTGSSDCMYKLDKFGNIAWLFPVLCSAVPVIHNGLVYMSSRDGRVFGIDMMKGTALFETKVCDVIGTDYGTMGVSEGVLITSSQASEPYVPTGGDMRVTALNASTGELLWQYSPQGQLWNFQPIFTGEGSFVFQDQLGGVYHLNTVTGEVLWQGGYRGSSPVQTWTDAAPMIGPNRIVYALHSNCESVDDCAQARPGTIAAYRLDDGVMVWTQVTPYSPNSQPVVAKLGPSSRLSVILPLGQPAGTPPSLFISAWNLPMWLRHGLLEAAVLLGDNQRYLWGNVPRPSLLQAYDAETGERQWSWEPPVLVTGNLAGDENHFSKRLQMGNFYKPVCAPNLWASPTVDAQGTIFVGHGNGRVYALRDANGDGVLDPEAEVQAFDAEAGFGPSGLAMAPGMAVIASCEGVLAFKD